jgi:hypothetical protein
VPTTARHVGDATRHVELDVDIGADAKDWSAIQATEKLKPVEADLRRMEEMVSEIVGEMDYLRTREQKLRDTNESTNNRVKWFGFCTTFILIVLWVWQILYLRAYFRFVSSTTSLRTWLRHLTDCCAPPPLLQVQAPYLNNDALGHVTRTRAG